MLRTLLARCTAAAMAVAEDPTQDLPEASARLALIQDSIRVLQVAQRDCQNQVIALTDTGKIVVPVGRATVVLERTETIKRSKWRHVDLAKAVIAKAYDLGQLTKPADAAPLICEMASISYWKGDRRQNSGLFRLGIDKDDYCEVERDGHVQLNGSV